MIEKEDLNFILRVFSELLFTSIEKIKYDKNQSSIGLLDGWIESKKIEKQETVCLTLSVTQDFFQRISENSENSISKNISEVITRLIQAEGYLLHVKDYFSQARIKEMMDWDETYPTSTGFEFIIFLLQEILSDKPSYLNHFWYNPGATKCRFEKIKEKNSFYLNIYFDSNIFSECLVYFKIIKSPGDCIWYKRKGAAIFPLNRIYKHHLIKFTNWLYIEHDASGHIRLTTKIEDTDSRPLIPVESSVSSGIEVRSIFLRAISRYKYRNENPYLVFRNNCEHFSTYCFYQSPRSRQVRFIAFIILALALAFPCSLIIIFPLLIFIEIAILNYVTNKYDVENLYDAAYKWYYSWYRFPK